VLSKYTHVMQLELCASPANPDPARLLHPLPQVALELVAGGPDGDRPEGVPNVPPFLVKTALRMVASSVKTRAGFDLYKCRPIDHAATCFMPALFATANDDALVRPHHSRLILDAYAGDKNLVTFEGDHNEMRPGFFLDSASIFFTNVLRLSESAALDVPTDGQGRPLPLSQAMYLNHRLRQNLGGNGVDAQLQQRMRAQFQAQLAEQQEAEAEMLARAIQESLDSASASNPPSTRRQCSSFTHAPLDQPAVGAASSEGSVESCQSEGTNEAIETASDRTAVAGRERDASDDCDEEALAEAIKLSLLETRSS